MATVNLRLSKRIQEPPSPCHQNQSVWTSSFDAEQRQDMINDDLLAGRSVSLVLISVVAAGLLMMILTVLASL